ncbi:MAG: hypothetical protein ACKO90_00680, partial [Microcystis panniformis]
VPLDRLPRLLCPDSPRKLSFDQNWQKIVFEGYHGIITGVSDRGELKVKLTSDNASSEIYIPAGRVSLGYN